MPVVNVHKRTLNCPPEALGALIDKLSGPDDQLWPEPEWPAMRFDRPLAVGAVGGHGPIKYDISHYQPGRWIRFRYTAPRGFHGFHEYTVGEAADGRPTIEHTVAARPSAFARLQWALVTRPLHDACIEDSFDRAERALLGQVAHPRRWSPYVRLLQWVGRLQGIA